MGKSSSSPKQLELSTSNSNSVKRKRTTSTSNSTYSTNNNSSVMDQQQQQQQQQQVSDEEQQQRYPLSEVVSECTKRWFQETLKEAKIGDVNMQIIVGQMYYNGYGIPKDPKKGKTWITRASRVRSSVWKISRKRPGYNASDSDSDDLDT